MTDYSRHLRKALSETLALVGSEPTAIVNTKYPAELASRSVVYSLLREADASRWAALSEQLPNLAEAAPQEFVDAVDALLRRPSEVEVLYASERGGFMGGRNPLAGLLWALEGLAWSATLLPQVTLCLGGLDSVDPGGNWANRALDSLVRIYLPWKPQTTASIEQRAAALIGLSRDHPKTAWKVYLAMLPGATRTTHGTHKPKWRAFAPDVEVPVLQRDYWKQVSLYADRVVAMAREDHERLVVLAATLSDLPADAFSQALATLEAYSKELRKDEGQYRVWRALERLVSRHTRFASASWAMPEASIKKIEELAKRFEPSSYERFYPLFASSNFELFAGVDVTSQKRISQLEEAQRVALFELWASGGWSQIVAFANSVERAFAVGWAAAVTAPERISEAALRRLVEASPKSLELAAGIVSRDHASGTKPIGSYRFRNWSSDEIALLLANLRISSSEVWPAAESALGTNKHLYWQKVEVTAPGTASELHHAVSELLAAKRPMAAIRIIDFYRHGRNDWDVEDAVRALHEATRTTEQAADIDGYEITELIRDLQRSSLVKADELAKLEWAYLQLLTGPASDVVPVTLERELATNPGFFCTVVRTIFRSEDALASDTEPTKEERDIASNAYRLLYEWRHPPGLADDGSFNRSQFTRWMTEVAEQCSKTGHFDVALQQVGPVLLHVPVDPSGLWIDECVAEYLNRPDMNELRAGYRNGLFNSRGVHVVDPSGAPEEELAEKYATWAADADVRGYGRLAAAMRKLAEEYRYDAEHIRSIRGYQDLE
jgi:hypothetical protein